MVDATRAGNIEISLKGERAKRASLEEDLKLTHSTIFALPFGAAFKDLSYEQIAEVISDLDPEKTFTGDRIVFLQSLLPTDIEAKEITRYKGTYEELSTKAEKFFYTLKSVMRIKQKVKCMSAMDTFSEEVSERSG